MTNIIKFTPRAKAEPEPQIETTAANPAPDKLYWLQDLQFAANYAAYLDRDPKAVQVIMSLQTEWLLAGRAIGHIPEAIRRHCAKYFDIPEDQQHAKREEVIKALYASKG